MKITAQKPAYEVHVEKYYDKTVRFIHRATEIEKIENELPSIAFDAEYLEKLECKVRSREEKAANILFTLNRLVLVERHGSPVYESLVEKVERLLSLWKEKTKDYEKIYKEGADAVNEIHALSRRQKELGFSDFEYSILLALEDEFGKHGGLISEVKNLSEKLRKHTFPGWIGQATVTKEIEREVRKSVRGFKKSYNLSLERMNDLYEKVIENVRNYGTS